MPTLPTLPTLLMSYLKWREQKITDFSDSNVSRMYNDGYLFGRTGRGEMYQTRSVRIDLSKFELSSENRRILRKTADLEFSIHSLPFTDYSWQIGKLAKDFYDTKFGKGTFSANKVKELLTDTEKSNFNKLFQYTASLRGESAANDVAIPGNNEIASATPRNDAAISYTICYENEGILHYSYPFYNLSTKPYPLNPNTGMGMMLKAIVHAKESGKKYIYLGSFSRPTDTYKLQFSGLEWFDGERWNGDLEMLKKAFI